MHSFPFFVSSLCLHIPLTRARTSDETGSVCEVGWVEVCAVCLTLHLPNKNALNFSNCWFSEISNWSKSKCFCYLPGLDARKQCGNKYPFFEWTQFHLFPRKKTDIERVILVTNDNRRCIRTLVKPFVIYGRGRFRLFQYFGKQFDNNIHGAIALWFSHNMCVRALNGLFNFLLLFIENTEYTIQTQSEK